MLDGGGMAGPTAWNRCELTRRLEEFGDPFDERDMEEELP